VLALKNPKPAAYYEPLIKANIDSFFTIDMQLMREFVVVKQVVHAA